MYPWLHYDITLDAAFCHVCMSDSLTDQGPLLKSSKRDPAFNTKGFTYWKDGTTALKKHQTSDCYREASEALLLPKQVLRDVGELLSQAHREEKAANRRMFVMILQKISYLATQGLSLRGDADDADSNFIQLLRLQSINCPEMKTWLEKKTDKYTSHKIQNECMQLMALHIIRNVAQNIRDSACFTIMADECTDVSNKEQFVIVIRWVSEDLQKDESFIGLYEVNSIDDNRLVHSIKDVLLRLNIKTYLIAVASVMMELRT
ncbi:uncharacterized protein LOC134191564 [Corticium candelabrum]|uniref:uncharacterized protein LOC134191564 n=1 Tax=Corticium candelabrum TaxID=121492 RepID=UPI002E26AECB|nr:uncharacterized protein LOC134191564 [Corticium candelabrum]